MNGRNGSAPKRGVAPAGPYRTPGRRREDEPRRPRPLALGFVVVWFLLGGQALHTCGDPGASRGVMGLGIGIVSLCAVVLAFHVAGERPRR